jgi:hypothetical protein
MEDTEQTKFRIYTKNCNMDKYTKHEIMMRIINQDDPTSNGVNPISGKLSGLWTLQG